MLTWQLGSLEETNEEEENTLINPRQQKATVKRVLASVSWGGRRKSRMGGGMGRCMADGGSSPSVGDDFGDRGLVQVPLKEEVRVVYVVLVAISGPELERRVD